MAYSGNGSRRRWHTAVMAAGNKRNTKKRAYSSVEEDTNIESGRANCREME